MKDAARLHAAIHHRLIAMSSFRAKQESMAINEDENRSHSQLLHSDSEDEEDDERKLCSSKMSGMIIIRFAKWMNYQNRRSA